MGWKCSPQVIGLTRGDPKTKSKHRANGKAIAGEMGEFTDESHDRITRSETYDPTRSELNEYEGYRNGFDAWDDMEERAGKYRQKMKNGAERSLRQDAVIGAAVIFNPPGEVCSAWTEEEYEKFYQDSFEVLGELRPEIFRKENIVMKAKHRDEGYPPYVDNNEHEHRLVDCIDREGRYCGNEIDVKFFQELAVKYPQKMRERGWTEMEDLDVTDWDRFKSDPDYKAQRQMKWRQNGVEVNKVAGKKSREMIAEAKSLLDESQTESNDREVELLSREEDNLIREEIHSESEHKLTLKTQAINEKEKSIQDGNFYVTAKANYADHMSMFLNDGMRDFEEQEKKARKKREQDRQEIETEKRRLALKDQEQGRKDYELYQRENNIRDKEDAIRGILPQLTKLKTDYEKAIAFAQADERGYNAFQVHQAELREKRTGKPQHKVTAQELTAKGEALNRKQASLQGQWDGLGL